MTFRENDQLVQACDQAASKCEYCGKFGHPKTACVESRVEILEGAFVELVGALPTWRLVLYWFVVGASTGMLAAVIWREINR